MLSAALSCGAFGGNTPVKVLFLAPHPDDDALYAGVLYRALRAGRDVQVLYFSNGESSSGMATSYLRELDSFGVEMALTPQARIAQYELVRKGEALSGLGVLEKLSGRAPGREFFDLPNISRALENPEVSTHVLDALERELRSAPGALEIYVPHPRDTNPGHRGTYEFLRRALSRLEPELRARVKIHAYMVHFGRYAGELGMGPRLVHAEPLTFATDVAALREAPLTDAETVIKLEMLLQHVTQLSRDDVLRTGSPLATGYLAGFLSTPETFEELPPDPALWPPAEGSLLKRASEMVHRFVGARLGGLNLGRLEASAARLAQVAARVLPPGSRAIEALRDAQFLPRMTLELRNRCQRALLGPWAVRGGK